MFRIYYNKYKSHKKGKEHSQLEDGKVLFDLYNNTDMTRLVRYGLDLDTANNEHAYRIFKNKKCSEGCKLCEKHSTLNGKSTILDNSLGAVSRFQNYSGEVDKFINYPIYLAQDKLNCTDQGYYQIHCLLPQIVEDNKFRGAEKVVIQDPLPLSSLLYIEDNRPDGDIVTFIGKTLLNYRDHLKVVIEGFDNVVNDEDYLNNDIYRQSKIVKV